MSSSLTHWRMYFPCPIDTKYYVEVSETQVGIFRQGIKNGQKSIAIVTGREINPRDSRTLYVNPDQVVLMEPRDD